MLTVKLLQFLLYCQWKATTPNEKVATASTTHDKGVDRDQRSSKIIIMVTSVTTTNRGHVIDATPVVLIFWTYDCSNHIHNG